jgi:transcriptional regulator with XRE-family HTH domain
MTGRRSARSPDTERLIVGLAAVSRMIRARDRLSQAEVARRSGVRENYIGADENARANPSVVRMGQLAQGQYQEQMPMANAYGKASQV